MRIVNLFRLGSNEQGSPGVLVCDFLVMHALELPDHNNTPNLSRIPEGEYFVTRRYSPSFGRDTYWIKNVPGRSYILLHGANFAGDKPKGWQTHLQGCVTLGMSSGVMRNKYGKSQRCVLRSREAIRKFEEYMNLEDFKLIIKDV